MARKLIEGFRRLPDFDPEGCVPIRLADGQEWFFPRPWLEITPVFRDGKAVDRTKQVTCGAELDVLIRAIADDDDPARQVLHAMTLGAFLLKRHYDLADDDLSRLFTYRVGEPDSEAMIQAIVSVATGKMFEALPGVLRDPKARPAGSGSA